MIENEEKLINILIKIDMIISVIEKLNSKIRLCKKNSEILGLEFQDTENISNETFCVLSNYIKENIEKDNQLYNKLVGIENSLNLDYESIKSEIESQIAQIESNQDKQIYQKANKLIYVAKWQRFQKEKEYYLSKNSLTDKMTGKAKFKKIKAQNIDLKSDLVKKEYYNIKDKYDGQSVRETLNMINSSNYQNNSVIEFKDSLLKVFMIDENTLSNKINDNWGLASLVPSGFFEQRKYYKILTENILKENIELRDKLQTNSNVDEESKIQDKLKLKFQKLVDMNNRLKDILNNI